MGHGHTDKQKLKQALRLAISDLKEADVNLARELARIDRRLDKGAGIGWACTQVAHLISTYLMTHGYRAPASVLNSSSLLNGLLRCTGGNLTRLCGFYNHEEVSNIENGTGEFHRCRFLSGFVLM